MFTSTARAPGARTAVSTSAALAATNGGAPGVDAGAAGHTVASAIVSPTAQIARGALMLGYHQAGRESLCQEYGGKKRAFSPLS